MILAMIVNAPFTMPDPPIPATALPTINIFDDVATPDRRDPSSKRPRKTMKQIVEEISRNFYMEVG
jgi:glutamine synthetase